MNVVDFMYERMGQFIKPGSDKKAWISANGKNTVNQNGGGSRFATGGCVMLISEYDAVGSHFVGKFTPSFVENTSDYITVHPIEAPGAVGAFLRKSIFNPPKGRFVLLHLDGKTTCDPSSAVINNDGSGMIVVTELTTLRRINVSLLKKTFALFGVDPSVITDDDVKRYRRYVKIIDSHRGGMDLTQKDKEVFLKEIIGSPFAHIYAALSPSQSVGEMSDYLAFLRDCNHG